MVCEFNLILLEIDAIIDCVHYTKTHPDDCEVNYVRNNSFYCIEMSTNGRPRVEW